MNIDVDNLSDAELRSKLMEFGYPVMPITGTTRKIMTKKLKMLLENKSKVNKNNRRSLGRYSSEEESDTDSKVSRKERRQTMAAPPSRVSTVRRKNEESPTPVKKEVKTVTSTTRTMRILQNSRDEYETGSESDEVAEKFDENDSLKKSPTRLPSSFVSASLAAEAASERLNQIRSRYSSYHSPPTPPPVDDFLKDKENTPFLSNFTKRLSQLSESPKSNLFEYKSDIKENDVNGGTSSRTYLNSLRSTRGRPSTYDYKASNQNLFKNNFIPFLVLVVAFLFFIIVAIVYLGIRSDTTLENIAKIPICDGKLRRFVNCIIENEKKPALDLLQVLKPELNRRALYNKCEDSKAKPYMTEDEIVTFMLNNFSIKDKAKIQQDLINIEVLSFFNPSWGINVLQLDEDGVGFNDNAMATTMEDVVGAKQNGKVTALIFRHPQISWNCYLYNTFWSFLSVLTSVIVGILILYFLNYIYKFYKQYRLKEHEEELTIVENIIDILQANANDNDDNYMVITHVRDMIIPITERKNKQKLWARAVKYLQENESRVRTEERVVQGEVTEVWRWFGGPTLSTSKNKSWQGQAFETQVGSVNSPPCSPTPCLKIRGMIEEGDRNTTMIRKAVLSKCAHQCRILHCAVDLNSKCVYLKCADPSDAAVAYRNLHGWWFAGNLVTVKYLRLERYMQRFPDSPINGPPFLQ